ncbi:MAG: hypothetical protein Q7T05_00810 [Dehalococcoidia bacterium]|nr:hypothetical protein [Dehalococcoidia bacterium]
MSVRIVIKQTGEEFTGKYALIAEGQVNLYAGRWLDGKGVWRRSSRRRVFLAHNVTVIADEPATEVQEISQEIG